MFFLWLIPVLIIGALSALATANLFIATLCFTALAILLLNSQYRLSLISEPLFQQVAKALPRLSTTEREALESGTVWWDAELFTGKPNWQSLLESKKHRLNTEEKAFLAGPTQQLCDQIDDWQITHHDHDLPDEIWSFLKEQGFFGLIIPKQYGGLGFSALAHSHVVMKVASRSITTAVTLMVPNSLGPAELLLHYGSQQQKEHYLPRLARGEDIPCFALTGPEAGSDASNLPDTGIVCQQNFEGKPTLGIRLNWEKRYITLGPVATLLGLAFHLYDPDHLIGGEDDIGITLALIPTDTEGVHIGRRHWPMGMAFQNGPNWGTDVFIPLDWIIGGVEQAGKGWHMLMESLAAGRSISLPALSAGAAKLATQSTTAYARIRQQFHLPISRFEGVAVVLGRMAALTYLIDATRSTTAQAVSSGERPAVLSAISKYHLTETMRQIVNDAMDVHGGKAISFGPSNILANAYQAIPISITVEGANILTRNLIIFGQGSIRAHPLIMQEMACFELANKEQAVKQFDKLVIRHFCYTSANSLRSFIFGITKGKGSKSPSGPMQAYYQQVNHLSSALTVATDICLALYGGQLKRKEALSARLGDVLSYLYLASCTLRHFHHQQQPENKLLAKWAVTYSIYNAQQALIGLIDNLHNRPVATLLRLIIFPLGTRYKAPSDQLSFSVTELLTDTSAVRDNLIKGIYQPKDEEQVLTILEKTFAQCITAEEIEKRVHLADVQSIEEALDKHLINNTEYQQVLTARKARRSVIEVDHFNAHLQEDVP